MEKLKENIQSVIDIYKSGDLSKAELLTKKLIKNNPKIVFLYNLLGLVLAEQKKDDQAMKCYEEGVSINPNFGMIYNNMGLLVYKNKNKINIDRAENLYKKAILIDNKIPEPHNNLGNLYNFKDKTKDAINCYKKAIEINPKFSYAHHNIGTCYVTIGKFQEAKKHFKESIKLNPNFFTTHRSLSRIIKYKDNDEHFIQMIKLYKDIDAIDFDKKIELGYALGKAYADTKDFDKSFIHYNEANLLQRKKINFSIQTEEKNFEKIKNTFNKELFDSFKDNGYADKSPIFIVGMPRSCTTLVEQILSSHHQVYGAEEVEFIPSLFKKNLNLNKDELNKIGKEYIAMMDDISKNSPITTDKLPINFLYIGFIKLILPKSKIVHCFRNPKDNCLSIFKNQFSSGQIKFAYDINEIVEYYELYRYLMLYWKDILPDFIYDIKYEDLISNTKKQVKNLLKYCNLSWDDNCLNFYNNIRPIKTASDTQVRNKIYNTSINYWKNYEKYLGTKLNKLKD